MQTIYLKNLVTVLALLLFCYISFGQNDCPNVGFETGTFANWVGHTGYEWNIDTGGVFGIVNGRHTIMTDTVGTDPATCDNVKLVAPGSSYSVRLGNGLAGCKAEKISYSMTVTLDNYLFSYQYAVVLEDPGHPPYAQPKFEVAVLDTNDIIIDSLCGYYKVTSSNNLLDFEDCNIPAPPWNMYNVHYRDWSMVGMDLSSYIGQEVTIRFTTKDCGFCGHAGYAYIDASCGAIEISVNYCEGDDQVTLTAPDGFTYNWFPSGDTTQSIVVVNPDTSVEYGCILSSVMGCPIVLNANMVPTYFLPDFDVTSCGIASFTDMSSGVNGVISNWEWDFGDPPSGQSNSSGLQDPDHTYSASGSYMVTLIVGNNYGCMDTLTRLVDIYLVPDADFNARDVCLGEPLNVNNTSTPPLNDVINSYYWDFGDNLQSQIPNPTHFYGTSGDYEITMVCATPAGCWDTISKFISVFPAANVDAGKGATILIGEEVGLNATGDGSFSWSPTGFLSCVDCADPIANPWVTTTFFTYLVDSNGCTAMDSVTVEVICKYPELVMPNVFTPNADGMNDKLVIENLEFTSENKLSVFNRWGEKVLVQDNYTNDWKGDKLTEGVYYYVIDYRKACPDAEVQTLTGHLTVLK